MKILERIRQLGGAMTDLPAVTVQSGAELTARLAEINNGINDGEGDVLGLLEEREDVTRRIQAVRVKESKKADDEYRADIQARGDEFRARAVPSAEQVADLFPRMLLAVAEYAELELESMRGAGNVNLPEETGIPFGFAQQLREAMIQMSRGIEWDFTFLDDPEKKNALPHVKQMRVDLRGVRPTDVHGRPLEGHTYL